MMPEVRWFSDIATSAFCETVQLRKILLERRRPFGRPRRNELLEPASAEFLSALAAGINSRHTLQVGCGLSTIALAAAARVTGSRLMSVYHEKDKQIIVQHCVNKLGLVEFVEFVTADPANFIPQREDVEFVFLSGVPERYIELFDLLKLKKGAIVVADNALDEATNDYIRHVRRQPGVDSSTLPLGRGMEITKIVTWDDFKRGRKLYGGIDDPINDSDYLFRPAGLQGTASRGSCSSSDPRFSSAATGTVVPSDSACKPHIAGPINVGSVAVQFGKREGHERGDPRDLYGVDTLNELDRGHTLEWGKVNGAESSQQGELQGLTRCKRGEAAGHDSMSPGDLDRPKTPNRSELARPHQTDQGFRFLDQSKPYLEQDITATTPSSNVHEQSVDTTVSMDPSADNFHQQFESLRGLADQWLEIEARAGNYQSGGSSSAFDTIPVDQMGGTSISQSNTSEPSVHSLGQVVVEASGADEGSQMELEMNDVLLPLHINSGEPEVGLEQVETAGSKIPDKPSSSAVDKEPDFKVSFKNDLMQTEITVEGPDQEMLLFDLTLAFNEMGLSVQRAKIATQDNYVKDVFYVVDGETRAPLESSRWDVVSTRILQRIAERQQLLGEP